MSYNGKFNLAQRKSAIPSLLKSPPPLYQLSPMRAPQSHHLPHSPYQPHLTPDPPPTPALLAYKRPNLQPPPPESLSQRNQGQGCAGTRGGKGRPTPYSQHHILTRELYLTKTLKNNTGFSLEVARLCRTAT